MNTHASACTGQTASSSLSGVARISHRAVRRASGKFMFSKCFKRIYQGELKVHADPIAALDALKLASLALQSTHSPRYGFPSRAARDDLDSAHRSRSL